MKQAVFRATNGQTRQCVVLFQLLSYKRKIEKMKVRWKPTKRIIFERKLILSITIISLCNLKLKRQLACCLPHTHRQTVGVKRSELDCFCGCQQQVADEHITRRSDQAPTLETRYSNSRSGLHKTCWTRPSRSPAHITVTTVQSQWFFPEHLQPLTWFHTVSSIN